MLKNCVVGIRNRIFNGAGHCHCGGGSGGSSNGALRVGFGASGHHPSTRLSGADGLATADATAAYNSVIAGVCLLEMLVFWLLTAIVVYKTSAADTRVSDFKRVRGQRYEAGDVIRCQSRLPYRQPQLLGHFTTTMPVSAARDTFEFLYRLAATGPVPQHKHLLLQVRFQQSARSVSAGLGRTIVTQHVLCDSYGISAMFCADGAALLVTYLLLLASPNAIATFNIE
ncbi:hypothetical protein Vafri_2530 [Volvox africanus]|uniref:Uncharacterized protein n=1 Tax=Volvox africanus TaxID=51714 RepID=A0A8J4APV3_9CHLO|nr:hypothetical protein Vafri_2530 [Volvox africanus]